MTGTTLTFEKQTPDSTDAMGNQVMTTTEIEVEDCLIAPITEPVTAREQQAIEQSRDQVRIYLPKAFTGNGAPTSSVINFSPLWLLHKTPQSRFCSLQSRFDLEPESIDNSVLVRLNPVLSPQ